MNQSSTVTSPLNGNCSVKIYILYKISITIRDPIRGLIVHLKPEFQVDKAYRLVLNISMKSMSVRGALVIFFRLEPVGLCQRAFLED